MVSTKESQFFIDGEKDFQSEWCLPLLFFILKYLILCVSQILFIHSCRSIHPSIPQAVFSTLWGVGWKGDNAGSVSFAVLNLRPSSRTVKDGLIQTDLQQVLTTGHQDS